MPPTWALLAYFHLRDGMPIWLLALVGASAATLGRAMLASVSENYGPRIVPDAWRQNIEHLVETIRSRRSLGLSALGVFTLNPVPSNHLFIAAGIARAPMLPILTVFFFGRFVSYLVWIAVADVAFNSLSDVLGASTGIWAVVIQIVGFIILILVMRIDWSKWLQRLHLDTSAPRQPDPTRD
jgi:membrane protein YqaA with SNARE-associated domain